MQVLLLDALLGRGIARISALLWFPPLPQFPLPSAARTGEDPSGRRYSTHVETSHERDFAATRHDPFEIRGFGPIFLPLSTSCNKANLHHPESRIFLTEYHIYLLPYIVVLICLHFRTYYPIVKKMYQHFKISLSKNYFFYIYIIIIIFFFDYTFLGNDAELKTSYKANSIQ